MWSTNAPYLLEARQTLTFDLETMFGAGATAGTVASVAIKSSNERPVATKIGTTAGGAYAVDSQAPVEPAYFPFDRHSAGEMPLVSVAGAGAADFESRWTLMDTAGVEQASAVREAGSGGGRGGVPWTPCSASQPRRCRWQATCAWNRQRPSSRETSSIIRARCRTQYQHWGRRGAAGTVFPYFVIGGGYNTVVTLINASDETAAVTATAFDADGGENRTGVHDPDRATDHGRSGTGRRFSEPAACAKGISRWMSCRPLDRTRSPACRIWPGPVRIEAPGSRAAAALTNEHGDEFFFTPVRSDEHEYTGLSILNEGPEEMEVLIEAYAADGELLDAAELIVAGRASGIGLLRELLPELGSAAGGYVRVLSTSIQMRTLALRGRLDGTGLLHLTAQTAPLEGPRA